MTCPYAHSDGAYVLGALSPAERSAYQQHLAGCAECAAAVAQLAPVPGLLGRADPAALEPYPPDPPSPTRLAQLVQVATSERHRQARRRRWRLAGVALASALLAVAGTAVGLQVSQTDPPSVPQAQPMQPVETAVPVTAEVSWMDTAAGTEVWMRCGYPDAGVQYPPRVFRLIAVGADGTREQVGSWLAGPGDEVTMTGVTRFTSADLDRLELRGYDDTLLLSYELR